MTLTRFLDALYEMTLGPFSDEEDEAKSSDKVAKKSQRNSSNKSKKSRRKDSSKQKRGGSNKVDPILKEGSSSMAQVENSNPESQCQDSISDSDESSNDRPSAWRMVNHCDRGCPFLNQHMPLESPKNMMGPMRSRLVHPLDQIVDSSGDKHSSLESPPEYIEFSISRTREDMTLTQTQSKSRLLITTRPDDNASAQAAQLTETCDDWSYLSLETETTSNLFNHNDDDENKAPQVKRFGTPRGKMSTGVSLDTHEAVFKHPSYAKLPVIVTNSRKKPLFGMTENIPESKRLRALQNSAVL